MRRTPILPGFMLCCGCDALRDTERAFCASCGEATDSYLYHPSEREEFELLAVSARPVIGFEREAHTGLVHCGEDRRAA